MTDRRFTPQEILEHVGSVEIFCPHMDAWKSSYKPVSDVKAFVDRVFDEKSQFRPVGRIEGRRMLVCMLPRLTIGIGPPQMGTGDFAPHITGR